VFEVENLLAFGGPRNDKNCPVLVTWRLFGEFIVNTVGFVRHPVAMDCVATVGFVRHPVAMDCVATVGFVHHPVAIDCVAAAMLWLQGDLM